MTRADAPGARWLGSPNFGPRRGGQTPRLVVLHYTAMDSARAALGWLCDPAAEVSAHYLIGRDGSLVQMVAEAERAWHAGAGSWGGCDDINSAAIGIELDNDGASPFSAALMDRLDRLLPDIMSRHGIAPHAVIGHQDMAPDRKSDPGPRFDWARLARSGAAVWPDAAARADPDETAFARALGRFGYPDASSDALLAAFRARFAPAARGTLSPADMGRALALAACWPVDARAPTA